MTERITITIVTENAAFEEHPASEIARILSVLADDPDLAMESGPIRDINGNVCGSVKVTVLR